jgi:folate-binding protein YgfZ
MSNPLHDLHEQAEAEFQAYADTQIVSTFGEPQAEYAAIRKSAALMDLPQRGTLELTGKDRLSFLNNLITNQTYDKPTKTGMLAGSGVYAFLLNAKSGRIVTDLNVIELGDRTLLEMDARLLSSVKEALEKYRFAEQVKIAEGRGWHEIALHGPQAWDILAATLASPLVRIGDSGVAAAVTEFFGASVVVWRDDPAGVPGYHLLIPVEQIRVVWMNLVQLGKPAEELGKRKLRPIGWAAFNAARIEAGRPMFGIDFDDTILPAETDQMNRAVSFTKGCYPGQEIVARMHARQAVAKQIAGLKFANDALPIAGAIVTDDKDNVVGGITSSTISPMLSNTAIAIALLKRPNFSVGTVLNVPAEGTMRKAVVTELPFLKPAAFNLSSGLNKTMKENQ